MIVANKTILIYRVGQLGDTLVALPAIQEIVRKHPGHRLVLLTDRHATARGYVSSWDILGPTGWIDEVIFYEPRDRGALGKLKQTLKLLLQLRRYRFSKIYNLVLRTTNRAVKRDRLFFFWLAGAKQYEGMPPLLYPPPPDLAGHLPVMVPEWRRLLHQVDAQASESGFRLPLRDASRNEALTVLPHEHQKKAAIAFAPGSKMLAKRWPEENFLRLGRLLLGSYPDLHIYIVGGPEDAALGERLCIAWGERCSNLGGKLSVLGSAALLEQCDLYVGNDTGTMHLAAMVGLPCVALFSARDYPGLWEPYGTGHAILRVDMGCAGCMLETCEERKNECLNKITTEDVFKKVATLLSDPKRSARFEARPEGQQCVG